MENSKEINNGTLVKKDITKLTYIILFILIIFEVITLFWTFKLNTKNQSLENELSRQKKLLLKLTPTPIAEPKNSILDLEKELTKVFSGTVEYKQSDNGYVDISKNNLKSYSSEDYELRYMRRSYHASVKAYKYVPGLKFENGYEGGSWFVEMDKWYNFISNATIGKNKGYVYDGYWGELNQYEKEFNTTMLGKRKFVVSSSNFQPAASWDHEYQTYDAQNKQFVVITLTFYGVGKNDDISCYSDVKQIFDQVENTINQIN